MKIKPIRKPPSYLKGKTARSASEGARKVHPDYFNPQVGTKYWIALLPAHPSHPQDEEGNPSPFVVVHRYFNYRTESGDIRIWPVLSDDLVKAGKDPLYIRSARLLDSEDEDDRKLGWKLKAKPRILMNVLVLAMKPLNGKYTKDVGVYGKKPHIMEVGGTTWANEFSPEFEDEDDEDGTTLNYDVFGQGTDIVPKMRIQKISKGSKAYEIDWKVDRTNKAFEISKKIRKKVHDILSNETNQPHTEKELRACLHLAAGEDMNRAKDEDLDIEFDGDEEEIPDEDVEDVPDPDDDEDEDEEEVKPKKKKKSKKVAKKSKSKKKSKKKKRKVVEEEDEDDDEEDDLTDLDDDDDDENFLTDEDDEDDDEDLEDDEDD